MRDVIGTPFELGGRQVGRGLDCLGVVGVIAGRLGLPVPDPWGRMNKMRDGDGSWCFVTGFPDGWKRVDDDRDVRDGDIWLFFNGDHPGCAIAYRGMVYTSSQKVGSAIAIPAKRYKPRPGEVWRYV